MSEETIVNTLAVVISGAPYPSAKSVSKARKVLETLREIDPLYGADREINTELLGLVQELAALRHSDNGRSAPSIDLYDRADYAIAKAEGKS